MASLSNTLLYFLTNNPTLDQYQLAQEYDTGLIKIGDGINPYKKLPYNIPVFTGTKDTAITAFIGGGQAGAYQLHANYNAIDSVPAAFASIKSLPAIKGTWHYVHNYDVVSGFDMNFYPYDGHEFYGMGINVPLPISPGNGLIVFCYDDGVFRF